MLFEVCCDCVESALNAAKGGAKRIELCSSLKAGGLTPSSGLIQVVCDALRKHFPQQDVQVFVMLRPRPGDFTYSEDEVETMVLDCEEAAKRGARGVVFGLLRADGRVDEEGCRRLVSKCREHDLDTTFHRAIDFVASDILAALTTLSDLGVRRVLTGGRKPTAIEGQETIGAMIDHVRRANLKMTIMAGGGLHSGNVAAFLATFSAEHLEGDGLELHGSLKGTRQSEANYCWDADEAKAEFGQHWVTDPLQVARVCNDLE